MSEPSNEFSEFETLPEQFAYTYKIYGAKPLRNSLAGVDGLTRESLEDTATELIEMDLPKVAAIVLEAAATAPSEADLCPYPEGTANAKGWHQTLRNRMRGRRKP
jgi:hypothetical protein